MSEKVQKQPATQQVDISAIVQQLRTEAVEASKVERERMLADAHKEAEDILTRAQQKAQALNERTVAEVERFRQASLVELQQASRDVLGLLVEQIEILFGKLLEKLATEPLDDAEFIEELIQSLTAAYAEGKAYSVIHGDVVTREKLEAALVARLGVLLQEGNVTLRTNERMRHGFVLQNAGESMQHECTPAAVREALRPLVRDVVFQLVGE